MRIIRSIRVDKVIWERAKVALKRNNEYISHYVESKLQEYIKKNDAPTATDKAIAGEGNDNDPSDI
jgi:hypothetical protein